MADVANAELIPSASAGGNGHPGPDAHGDLYLEVLHFYARQMQLLDDALVEEWAETFTEEGIFAANAQAQPTMGRKAIAAAARATTDDLARRGIRRRHWIGMPALTGTSGDGYRVRSYALVIETTVGGQSGVRMSTLMDDRLVRVEGRFLVDHRQVTRDDLP
ncbi:MAG: hypothetical protein QOH66_2490 [Actinomycetota bacterium]|jgi:3-phenylpropionate/cinnamic acid dioxygenase small subunit|nr:hypothetical protein [Actinomycetota bacterium]